MMSYIITVVCMLVGMAFFTLCERKLLGYFHLRKGPNKVGILGVLQPFADAGKLFTKERLMLWLINKIIFIIAPFLLLFLSIFMWCMYPIMFSYSYIMWSVLLFLCISSVNVYGTMMAGWGSNSKYALFGGVRAVAQTISYEVSLSFILLVFVMLGKNFMLMEIYMSQVFIYNMFLVPVIGLMWFVSIIAETNRAPFDFVEGESELVSGFNVEYGGYLFAMIFMAEYMSILFMSMISVCFLLGVSLLSFSMVVLCVSYIYVLVRASYPRFRYDLLMGLTWKCFLPLGISFLVCLCGWFFI